MAIDIGSLAIARDGWGNIGSGYTRINLDNPANDSGAITSIDIYALSGYNLSGCIVGTVYLLSGTTYKCRDAHEIGDVTAGSAQNFEVDLDVVEGDYIGVYFTSGYLFFSDLLAGSGYWHKIGDYIPCTDQTFILFSGGTKGILSLYGTGATVEVGGGANILFIFSDF